MKVCYKVPADLFEDFDDEAKKLLNKKSPETFYNALHRAYRLLAISHTIVENQYHRVLQNIIDEGPKNRHAHKRGRHHYLKRTLPIVLKAVEALEVGYQHHWQYLDEHFAKDNGDEKRLAEFLAETERCLTALKKNYFSKYIALAKPHNKNNVLFKETVTP